MNYHDVATANRRPSLTRLRTRHRRNDAHLDRNKVFAAHRLYWNAGLSIPDLANRIGIDESALRKAFTRHGLRIRSQAEATRLAAARTGCTGCGIDRDKRTPGCPTCTARHWHRRRHNTIRPDEDEAQ